MTVKAVRPGFAGRVIEVNVETVTLPNGATVRRALSGAIDDGKTIAGLCRAQARVAPR